jgi:hypothetical protein
MVAGPEDLRFLMAALAVQVMLDGRHSVGVIHLAAH